ncbi:MAG: hypothetical protein Ct9H90mP16_16390 [Candidatus Poseidoniales archaeon]|nr:MAG: hypothetical protein Ct9H90mP16_16390 [Candidatus Poseidoniales archaeon]
MVAVWWIYADACSGPPAFWILGVLLPEDVTVGGCDSIAQWSFLV